MTRTMLWVLAALASLLIGLGAGAAAAWWRTGVVDREAGVGPGYWRAQLEVGGARAGDFQRAVIARTGIWALPSSEVVYYVLERDDEGQSLTARCDYVIEAATEPRTRWWSINAYREYKWMRNAQNRYSFTSTTIERKADGGYVIDLSDARGAHPNWLPRSGGEGRLTLLFRLYHPDASIASNPAETPLPSVRRGECD